MILSLFAPPLNPSSIQRLPARALSTALILFLVTALFSGCLFAKNTTPPGADTPLARVRPGMGKTQTRDIAGAPDDFGTVYRGTSVLGMVLILPLLLWDIPLFLNRTDHLTTWYYKNEGRIHFTRDGFVRQVIYDPSEDGYRGE